MIEDACARPKAGLSRRTLVAGAVWTTPVVLGLMSAPAASASTVPFTQTFSWTTGAPTVAVNYSAIQLSGAMLKNVGNTTLTGSVVLSVSPNPKASTTWVCSFDVPSTGTNTATFSVAAGSTVQFAFQAHTSDWAQIAPGTYTLTMMFTMGNTTTSYPISVTV